MGNKNFGIDSNKLDDYSAEINKIKNEGIEIAIVDVNDLGRVKILAASSKDAQLLIKRALYKNPAGNANEQTPIVLIRPRSKKTKVSLSR